MKTILVAFLAFLGLSAFGQITNATITVQLGQPVSANYLTANANLTNSSFYGSVNFAGPLVGLSMLTNSDGSPLISSNQTLLSIAAALAGNTNSPTFAQATNIAQAQALLIGLYGTNFTLASSNSIYTNLLAALQGTNAALAAAITASNVLQAANIVLASNTLAIGKQPASGYLTNLALTGAYTNSLIGSTNIIFTTNLASGVVSISAALQTGLTNGLAQWNGLQPTSYLQTNVLPALTNSFISQNSITGFVSAVTAAATYYPTSNPSGFVTASITNGLGTNAYPNSNPSNFLTSVALAPYPTTNQVYSAIQSSNATLATFASIAATNAANLALTTNLINSASNGLSSYSAAAYDTNGAAVYYSKASTNGLLAQYATTNQNNIWYDTNGSALVQYTNAVNTSTNFANTNAAAQIATAISNFGSTNAAPFVSTNAGHIQALTINTSLQFGADTNFVLSTNWISVKGAGVGLANGNYMQTAVIGVWTNTSNPGYSIVNSAGVYNLLNTNGQTLYLTNTVNGFWLVGPFGFVNAPYVAYAPTEDPILLGYVYATNLTAQTIALINQLASSPTNGTSPGTVSNIVNNYGGTLFQPIGSGGSGGANTNLSNISQAATNVIQSLINGGSATNAIGNNNGRGTNTTLVGTEYLNNSNLVVNFNAGGALIPQMTSTNTPSGQIYGGAPWQNPYTNFYAFQTNEPSGKSWQPTTSPAWIEYDFGGPVTASYVSGQFQSSAGGTGPYYCYVSNSVDNVIWNYVCTITNLASDAVQTSTNIFGSNISGRYWLWNFPKPGSSQDSVISQLQLYGPAANTIASTSLLQFTSTNGGVAINTNSANGNALEVNGNVDSSVGYTVNGLPVFGNNSVVYSPVFTNIVVFGSNNISGSFFQYGGMYYNGFQVSGAPSYNTLLNGIYVSATNNNTIYTNPSGYAIYFGYGSLQYIGTNSVWAYTNLYGSTNVYSRFSSYGPIGIYSYTTISTNQQIVQSQNPFVTVSYALPVVTNASVAINTNSAGTNTLEVFGNANIDGNIFAAMFTGNGFTSSGLTNKGTTYIPTNTAPWSRVYYPMTLGSSYTTPPQRGYIFASVICTNGLTAMLSNMTSHDVCQVQTNTSKTGTNQFDLFLYTQGSDIVTVTNFQPSGVWLGSNYWIGF